ncbi:FHA domain-containing protein [Janthinobacterium agaricidamnosum]|uniref:FHA domain protein n=1 Tax=Janthinobacterium agaricidamnosum NBRC 102515 = DSM 9628 TaxID=1349767 RepID=W0V9K8_9BURK|nr:FHA domain-containing protein [Janthinobacterium agaricidamnosum]CDG83937.1 FHA domain protein [Janthinobacterium agaricidamnosum NBRC 102515 = DSM 9628]
MKAPYFIETLARNGDVLNRQQVASLPIRLGRAYDNDVILDDLHTAPQHALIEDDGAGGLVLRDLGSLNGSIHHGKREASIALSGHTVVRLGHTSLRVRGADHAVPAELTDTAIHSWEGRTPALLGLAMVALAALVSNWIGDVDSFDPINYLLVIAGGLGGALVWGGVWAVANRLFGSLARFGRHLFILGCGLVAMEVWIGLSSAIAYAYSQEWLTRFGSHVVVAIICCMIFFHLCTIKARHARRFAAASAILLILISGLNLMSGLQRSGRLGNELYMSVLLPPAFRLSANHGPDEFFANAARLKARVDADRNKHVGDDISGEDDDGGEDE